MHMDYVAIDFETANSRGDSVCSIGLSRFSDGKEVDRYYALINPRQYFSRGNIQIHGITEAMVSREPSFNELYPVIRSFIGTDPLVAHFAQFDMSCLQQTIETYKLPKMQNEFFCSCKMAQRMLDLHNNRLPTVLDYFGMTIDNHHNAVEDAVACGLITSKMLAQYDYDIQGFLDEYQYRMGKLFSHAFGVAKGGKSTPARRTKTAAPLKPKSLLFDREHVFYDKHVCFTGRFQKLKRNDLAQLVVDVGGHFDANLSYETLYLVVADSDWRKIGTPSESRKIQAVRELQGSGHNLTMLSESDFLRNFLKE